jgi:hypothetical protein
MMVVTLVVGIGLVLAGLLAIGFGIPVQEFSFGNTLILAGVMAGCTGFVLLGLWMAVRELKSLARRLGNGIPSEFGAGTATQPTIPIAAAPMAAARGQAPGDSGSLFTRDRPTAERVAGAEPAGPAAAPPPWHEEATSRGVRSEPPPAPEAAPAPAEAAPKRRNLLFSSTSRKERERAQARTAEPLTPDMLSPELRPQPPTPPPAEPAEAPPATFDDAWPKLERAKLADAALPPRRSARAPSTFSEANGAPASDHPPAPREEQPPVTVLKSGVVDGMAYSLYSDGSIEAQMPEGMMRFASIDELRSHLDQRP